MRLVVDTNVLFSFFKKNSFTRGIILNGKLDLISPQLSLQELKKYSEELKSKSKINEKILEEIFLELPLRIIFIPDSEYENCFCEALKISEDIPESKREEFKEDIDFFALAIRENCAIWSNDSLFKEQHRIKIFNSLEIAKEFRV